MKKALLIGCNYIGTPNELKGCINDVFNMKNFLVNECSYTNIYFMTDVSEDPLKIPTKTNVLNAIKTFVGDSKSGDTLFFHYSGHGGSIRDTSKDEMDMKDETLYLLDDYIKDDDLKKYLVDPLPSGVMLNVLLDCCHSGTMLDIKYNYYFEAKTISDETYSMTITKKCKDSLADVVMISGCLDSQTSADTVEGGKACGALTYSFLETMKKLKTKKKFLGRFL